MLSLALGLTFASYASAQVFSMVDVNASGSAASSSSTGAPPASTMSGSSSSDYSSAAPTMSMSSSDYNSPSGYSPPPSYTQYGNNQYTSPPAQYTPPPQTEAMPYQSFMSGGYKSMGCGYGYQKGNDGSCTSTESWVRNLMPETLNAMGLMWL
jgi:hypothetical protein